MKNTTLSLEENGKKRLEKKACFTGSFFLCFFLCLALGVYGGIRFILSWHFTLCATKDFGTENSITHLKKKLQLFG
jgi:hypothetical protein